MNINRLRPTGVAKEDLAFWLSGVIWDAIRDAREAGLSNREAALTLRNISRGTSRDANLPNTDLPVTSLRDSYKVIEIEISDCRKCPFHQTSQFGAVYCSYLANITGGQEGMEMLGDFKMSLEDPDEITPPGWCGLKRAAVTVLIDPLHESRCPEGGDHEPVEKLTATICDKCRVVLDNHPRVEIPVGYPYCDECKRAGSTHSALCDCNCHRGGELPF